jgi:hypothetical protein
MINSRQLFLSITVALLCLSTAADAQRGGRGGGGRGGGGRGGGGGGFRGGGGMSSRGSSRPSVSRPAGGGRSQLPANISRPSGGINRPNGGINAGNGNISRGDINVDRGNINVNRPVNVGDGGWDNNYGGAGWGCCYHPVARAAAVTAAAVATAAVIGSVAYTLPASCTVTVVNGLTYQQCGSTWYQPQFVGDETTYVVVNPP